MQLVFIDDSGTQDPPRQHLGELVSVGAVIFPEESVAPYAQALATVRSEIGMPPDQEIKWNPPKGSWLAQAGFDVRNSLRRRMLELAAEAEVRTAVVVWDRGALPWEKKDIASEILRYLYERIEIHLETLDQRGVVIADVPGGGSADHTKWLSEALDLATAGTPYVKPNRVIMPIVTAPSHHVLHIQLADLVTAATTAAVAGRTSGLGLVDLLKPLARRNAYQRIGGAGVVLWPPDLVDLYHWLFGETVLMKKGIAYPIGPQPGPFAYPGRPFQSESGLQN